MTFFVKSAQGLITTHDIAPQRVRRCATARAVVSTVDHADIRGLTYRITEFRLRACPHSRIAHRMACGRLTPSRVAHITGPGVPHSSAIKHQAAGSSRRAASQMNAASSRATAVTATLLCLPRALIRRNLWVSRSCAFQASARMSGSMCCDRCSMMRLTLGV